jgi:hypothetical protein
MIVRAQDGDGERNFEAHPLVQYYHEVIQATRGSDWVWCMTLASAIEGLTKASIRQSAGRLTGA